MEYSIKINGTFLCGLKYSAILFWFWFFPFVCYWRSAGRVKLKEVDVIAQSPMVINKSFLLSFSEHSRLSRVPADTAPLTDPLSAARVLCGALVMPTIATIVGKLMFGLVQSNFQRTLLVSEDGPNKNKSQENLHDIK